MGEACPCGFLGLEHGRSSSAWYVAHRERHLAAFPEVDGITRANLDALVGWARLAEEAGHSTIVTMARRCVESLDPGLRGAGGVR
jgi:hypothetical protein